MIRTIRDPEKPNTLEELEVVSEKCVEVQELGEEEYLIIIRFSPTVPHCSLATLIGEAAPEPGPRAPGACLCCGCRGCRRQADGLFVSAGLCLQVKLQRCLPFKHKVSGSRNPPPDPGHGSALLPAALTGWFFLCLRSWKFTSLRGLTPQKKTVSVFIHTLSSLRLSALTCCYGNSP